MSFLCYTGRILRAPADARTLGEVLPARVRCCVQRTISLKSAQISYFVLTVPSYPDQVPVTPIKVEWSGVESGMCLYTTRCTVRREIDS